ncbi:protein LIAT1 isoform X2 [Rhineura floridana]|uniref:protein LIAT1 isoform X2 n=1 Tax=Rhineura floridana TaxID=261503 RepID=UPI002AC820B4|nr:protein LIAT1 isoform X2 [Rhineura floridana]
MEVCRPDLASEGEGAKANKPPAKEPPHTPQTSRKKKASKKKKKKAVQENGKHASKSKKHSIFVTSPLELLHRQSGGGVPQGDTSKATPGEAARGPLSNSTSTISFLAEGDSELPNESLRWDGILDDPTAEKERLWIYRLNRRRRYRAHIQQNLPAEPSFALKHLPQLGAPAHVNGEHLLCKSKSSTTTSVANKDQSRLNSKILTKASKRQSALMPSISQEIV